MWKEYLLVLICGVMIGMWLQIELLHWTGKMMHLILRKPGSK